MSGPPPGPTPAAPAWLSDTEERLVKRGKKGKKKRKRKKQVGKKRKMTEKDREGEKEKKKINCIIIIKTSLSLKHTTNAMTG